MDKRREAEVDTLVEKQRATEEPFPDPLKEAALAEPMKPGELQYLEGEQAIRTYCFEQCLQAAKLEFSRNEGVVLNMRNVIVQSRRLYRWIKDGK